MLKRVFMGAFVVFLFDHFGLYSVMAQAQGPAPVFRPALAQIQSRMRIPILLPSKLPPHIGFREQDIKLASGETREDGYYISLYFTEDGIASYAAGFGGSRRIFRILGGRSP